MQNNLIQSALKLSFTCICLAIFFSCNTHAEIESRIDTLEKVVSVSLSKQMDDMQKSITRLESANSHLEQLVSEIGDDVSSLKSQKAVFEKDIADLRLLIESQSSNLQSWAEGLFSTLSQYQKITEDIAVIKKSLSEYEGEINKLPLLQKELENCEIDITLIKDELLQIIDNIDSIKKQIAQIIESIQSVVVIPDYSDGSILMTGSNANEIKFEVYPLSAAENISKIGVSALSLDYVTTETKSSDVMANIPILKTSFNGRSLSVIADGTDLPQNVLSGEQPINARLRVSDGTVTRSSDYFPIHFKKDICLTLAADLIAPTTVRLSGYAEGLTEHPDDISVGFEYSTAADMSDAHKINALLNENEKTFSIICSGLAPESVYFYRAYFLMQEDAPPRPAAAPSLETVLTAAHTAANNSAFSWRVLLAAASLAAVALIAWEVATPGAHPGAQIAQRQPAPQPAAPLQNTTPVLSAALPASAEQAPVIAGAMLRDPYLDNLLAAHRQAAGASGLGAASGFLRNATFEGDAR